MIPFRLRDRDPELAYRIADEAILIAQRDPHTFAARYLTATTE